MKETRQEKIARLNGRSTDKALFKKYFSKLSKKKRKILFSMIVHYWVSHQHFLSKHNFFNLWCELNSLCYELNESFPDPYEDREELKAYCHAHPYYFIDILTPKMIATLFAEYVDDRLDILASITQKLYEEDTLAAFTYANEAWGLNEDIEDRVAQAEAHVEAFS